LAWRLGGRWLDLIQLVYFPYASMDVREPFVAGALFAVALVPAAAAARDWVAGRRRRAIILAAALIALDAGAALFGAYRGVGRPLTPPSASGRTAYVVLTDGPRGPGTDTYELAPDVFSDPDPRPYLRGLAAAPRDARNLPALRALYQEESKRWDLDGLRDALLLGVARRDPLAPSLLLSHFTAVRRSTQALAALGVVSDESAWRVGPLGAAALARAYAHLGDRASAARWAARSGEAGGIAPGLLGLDAVGTGAAGRVTGVLRGADHARVALYSKEDPAAPYLLGAAGLAASVEPDSRGRFVFTGLTAGRYYLAVALPGGRGEAAVTGGRGDIVLDAVHPARVLPPLTASFTAR
ncbi:MAG: hypothetical protein KGL74_10480, partial [Elusimicrobia bacterium]|nr:hypothetical protein [Elusimicrobiota bacterium]